MNAATEPTHPALQHLAALLPPGETRPEAFCPEAALRRLEEHWGRLQGLGFELGIRAGSLQVRHGNRGFETVLHFGGPDDLGERRQLFAALKATFGGFRDRFPWLWQPSPAVTVPYESLKAIAEVCQAVRTKSRRAG